MLFLRIETLIFYFPPHSFPACHAFHIFFGDWQICEEPEFFPDCPGFPLFLPFFAGLFPAFPIFYQVYFISVIIDVGYVIMPSFPCFQRMFPAVLFHPFQFPVFLPNGRDASFLIPPALSPASFKEAFTGIQAVCAQADGQPWKRFFQLFHQPPAGFPLTVLLFRFLSAFIVHEFRLDADEDFWMQHKPRLQYVIIVLRPLFFRSLIMGAAQPFSIQFPMGAAKRPDIAYHCP